ncbi:MAG: Precorrin-6B methylase 2, partial [Lachnospiraceae bacterium]|nr:Precorrin-6B methylase 2 [Lachnospiraceae bacterium]
IVSGESIAIEAAIVASEGTIIAVEGDKGSQMAMEANVEKFGVHNVEIVRDLSRSSLSPLPTPRLAFIVATKNLEQDIQNLLAINPKMQFVIYTLELDILSGIKDIFHKYNLQNMEMLQISVSKLDSKSVFVTQPAPWLITGEA